MATLPKVLISRADYQIGGGVALRLRTQGAAAPRHVDAGIVDNRVHAADRIYLLCYAADLGCAAQVTDYDPGGLGCEVGKRRGALARSCIKHDLMAVIEKRPRRRTTEPIGAAGDKNARH